MPPLVTAPDRVFGTGRFTPLGKIVTDLAVALALGGDCPADVAMLCAETGLFGPAASDPVVSRLAASWPRTRRGR